MNSISVELPGELASELASLGLTSESRISEWVADAVRQKLSAAKQMEYLQTRAARGDRNAFENVMSKVPSVEPADADRW
jgi:metal-responsive CopG/Arc/MetJ family transcriptional regulator